MTLSHYKQQPTQLFPCIPPNHGCNEHSQAAGALLSLMLGVQDFGRAVGKRLGQDCTSLGCFTGVSFRLKGCKAGSNAQVQPDGIIEFSDGDTTWRAMLEVSVGEAPLDSKRIKRTHRLAKQENFDALITIGNQVANQGGAPPIRLDESKLEAVPAIHLSWDSLFQEAQWLTAALDGSCEKWMVSQWLSYMDNPVFPITRRFGLGPNWPQVEEMAQAGTLQVRSEAVQSVAQAWRSYLSSTAQKFSEKLGVPVTVRAPEKELGNDKLHTTRIANRLVNSGALSGRLQGAGFQGNLLLALYPAAGQACFRTDIDLPEDRSRVQSLRRLAARLRRIESSPSDTVHVHWDHKSLTTNALVSELAKDPLRLQMLTGGWKISEDANPVRVIFERTVPLRGLGVSRSAQYLDNLSMDLEEFCENVVQKLRETCRT